MSTNSNNGVVGKGRRRRRLDDEGEDGASDNKDPNAAARSSECESEGEGPEIGSELSEYESAMESADQEEETEEGSETDTETGSETESGSETETEGGDVYTDEEGLDQERQSGDGEEQPDNEKPDDDEDKKNPAYVPRRGAFYEHDFRQGDEGPEGEEEEPAKEPAKPVKKLWQEEGKWSHDRYIDDLQAPKTREELIAIYGYDIRASDKPPEAPPKRPDSGAPRGPRRDRKFQDFVPRMAVIDTTEDGADSVPHLDGENFIPYNSSSRQGGSHSDFGRGRRGGSRGGGRGNYRGSDVDNHNYRNRQEGSSRFNNDEHSQDARINGGRYQGSAPPNDFPSLQESTQQRDRKHEERSNAYERLRRDSDYGDERRDRRRDVMESRGSGSNRRVGYGDGGDGRFSNSQDARRGNDNWRGGSHSYNQSRDGSKRGGIRQGEPGRGAQEDNWRSANYEARAKGDSYRKDQRDNRYGDKNRGPRMGNSGDYRSQTDVYDKHGHSQGYEQPQHYQQMKQEFTNTSLKTAKDRPVPATQRGPAENKKTNNTMGLSANSKDSADISKNVVVSSSHEKGQREKVQTINVTITSTTTEKKSYAKERRAKGTAPEGSMSVGASDAKQVGSPLTSQSSQYGAGGTNVDSSQQAQGKRYSSQRQQAIANRPFTEPPPSTDSSGTKLYNPAMPPPPFFPRDQTAAANPVPPPNVQQPPLPPSVGVADPARFAPTMLPPVTVPLQYPLPVSNASGLALPPSAAGVGGVSVNPAIFQQASHPPPSQGNLPAPPPGTPIMAPPFLPAGMIYSGSPRVPPPHNAAQAPPFPLPMAYTSPPPQAPVAPQSQPGVPQQAAPATSQPQHKVYRGDITYYAPELQQPPRAPQKRPKAAIPIIDPQVIREQKKRERLSQQEKPESGRPIMSAPIPHSNQSQENGNNIPVVAAFSASSSMKEMADPDAAVIKAESDHHLPVSGTVKQEMQPNRVSNSSAKVSAACEDFLKEKGVPNTPPPAATGVKKELPDPRPNSESKDSQAPQPLLPSQPVLEDKTISIVAVDSRPPLTIVQSFNDPAEVVEKGVSALQLKKEGACNAAHSVDETNTKDGVQCSESTVDNSS